MRIGALGATLLALVGGARADEVAVTVDHAPQAWITYAQLVSQHLQAALTGDDERAHRFNAFFGEWVVTDAHTTPVNDVRPEADLPATAPTLKVKVWLDPTGHVTRAEFDRDRVDDDQAVADLRALLMEQSVGAPPPRRMKQPVVVRLELGAEL